MSRESLRALRPTCGRLDTASTPMEEVRADSPHRQRANPSPAPAAAEIASLTSAVRSGGRLGRFRARRPNTRPIRTAPANDCRQERAASRAPRGMKTSACPTTSARSARVRLSKYDQNGTTISSRQNGGSGQANLGGFQAASDDGQAPDQERRHDPAAGIHGRGACHQRRADGRAESASTTEVMSTSRPGITSWRASMARLRPPASATAQPIASDAAPARFPRRQGEQAAGQHPGEQLARPQPGLRRRCRALRSDGPNGISRAVLSAAFRSAVSPRLDVKGERPANSKPAATARAHAVSGRDTSNCRIRTDATGQIQHAPMASRSRPPRRAERVGHQVDDRGRAFGGE